LPLNRTQPSIVAMFSDLRAIDVFAAAARISGAVLRTPLRRSTALSTIAGGDVYLKCENEQPTGSFKIRGAYNAVAMMDDAQRAAGVVASSAGNHGLGVASASKAFGIRATIFVPKTAPEVKKRGIAELGATVDDSQPDYDAAMVAAKEFAAEHGALYINPCLGAPLLAGQGTVGLEIVEDLPEVATIVLPVGGGGLLGGVGSIVRRVGPHIRIIGAQSEETAAMSRSVAANALVSIPSVATLADGLAGQIDDEALDIGRNTLDGIVTLSEDEIGRTIAWLHAVEGITAEGAGAVAVGAIVTGKIAPLVTPAVVVVSGGNIDGERHGRLLERYSVEANATSSR
jgi:threonine dehydratase